MPEPFLTAAEVATWLNLHVETVYALIEREDFPAVRVGAQWRFQESAVQAWLTARNAARVQLDATTQPSARRRRQRPT
jgi:excisionase family DNA binding protein